MNLELILNLTHFLNQDFRYFENLEPEFEIEAILNLITHYPFDYLFHERLSFLTSRTFLEFFLRSLENNGDVRTFLGL